MPATISSIRGLEILDSRGLPTVQATVTLSTGQMATASVPSGRSTGSHEAKELRDHDLKRFGGEGEIHAVHNVNGPIARALKNKSVHSQERIDEMLIKLDGTPDKHRLGANAILAVSLAVARARAVSRKLPLFRSLGRDTGRSLRNVDFPQLLSNVINGGAHADNGLTFQEFFVIPDTRLPKKALMMIAAMSQALQHILKRRKLSTLVGDEGGFAPTFTEDVAPLKLFHDAAREAGLVPGRDLTFGFDAAATEFWKPRDKRYAFSLDRTSLSPTRLIALYREWIQRYHVTVIEDGLAEDAWEDWAELTRALGKNVTLIGDDLFVTDTERLQEGIRRGVANAILIKVNQIGTLTEALAAIRLAQQSNYRVVISHRSGETTDSFIADLAVAVGAEYLKAGALSRGERLAKYNRLLEIAAET
jgi:enolase